METGRSMGGVGWERRIACNLVGGLLDLTGVFLATWDGIFVLEFGMISETETGKPGRGCGGREGWGGGGSGGRGREGGRGKEGAGGIVEFIQAGFLFPGLSLHFFKHFPCAMHLLWEGLS